jgi:hypothetical protein
LRIYVTGRRGRRRKQLLDDLKETRGYWKCKEEELFSGLWRTRFGRGYDPLKTTYGIDDKLLAYCLIVGILHPSKMSHFMF